MSYDVNDVMEAANVLYELKEEQFKEDREKVVQQGSLIRWHVMMVLKGIGGKIRESDWILFEHEKKPQEVVSSKDLEEHQKTIKQMDEEHRIEVEEQKRLEKEKLEAYRNKFRKLKSNG